MKRADRLLAIVLELQSKKQVRAEDLAAIFDVTKRTIYRDMLALDESGVPIMAIPGQGYALVEGYFLPPLSFSSDEAIMLLLGADFIGQSFDAQGHGAAQSAHRKIVAVLPVHLRHEVEYLQRSIQFIALDRPAVPDALKTLRQAIIQRSTVRFRYHARYHDSTASATSQREADPYALIHIGGAWTLIAYCHMRRDRRHFRLDRMEDVAMLDDTFVRPPDFAIQRGTQEDRTVVVRALFDHTAARRVQEAPSGFQVAQAQHPEGLLVTLTVRQPDDVVQWLLSWGARSRAGAGIAACAAGGRSANDAGKPQFTQSVRVA